ncbi:hypothetical protein LJB42_001687 [Komagataella kurtzmanii]|nr:hypothetical protein LJB42_001687 [Komagataella kurtzmanii]
MFSFLGVISSQENQQLWVRTIYSLSQISEHVQMKIRKYANGSDEIILESLNLSRTTLLRCQFGKSFFSKFSIDGELPISENVKQKFREVAILLNSRSFSLLFKSFRVDDVDLLKFSLAEVEDTEQRLRTVNNKLFVEVVQKTQTKKLYALNYVGNEKIQETNIIQAYKEQLKRQESRDRKRAEDVVQTDDSICHINMDVSILKEFFDMLPNNVVDFKIDIYPDLRKCSFQGFDKQQLLSNKVNSLLKQPISLSVAFFLNEFNEDNIDQQLENKLSIIFPLKEFRAFVSLLNEFNDRNKFFKTTSSENGTTQGVNVNNDVDLLFRDQGWPILFEKDWKNVCRLVLVQLTESDEIVNLTNKEIETKELNVAGFKGRRLLSMEREQERNTPMPETNTASKENAPPPQPQENGGEYAEPLFVPQDEEYTENDTFSYGEVTEVRWNRLKEISINSDDIQVQESMNCGDDNTGLKRPRLYRNTDESDEEMELGPTQIDRVQGLFD